MPVISISLCNYQQDMLIIPVISISLFNWQASPDVPPSYEDVHREGQAIKGLDPQPPRYSDPESQITTPSGKTSHHVLIYYLIVCLLPLYHIDFVINSALLCRVYIRISVLCIHLKHWRVFKDTLTIQTKNWMYWLIIFFGLVWLWLEEI